MTPGMSFVSARRIIIALLFGTITTVIRGTKLVRPRFVPIK